MYIKGIQDMYEGAMINIWTPMGLTKPFSVQVGLHQGSALSLFLFVAILDKLSKDIRDTVP